MRRGRLWRGALGHRARFVISLVAISVFAGCGRPVTPPERADAAAGAPAESTEARRDQARALAELKAAARRRLAADRAAVQNQLGYEQALTRQRRDAEATGLNERIPTAPVAADALEALLAAPVRSAGGRLRDVRLGVGRAGKPVPAAWDAEGPYPFEVEQLVERLPLAVEVDKADEGVLSRVFEVLRRADGPLLDIDALRVDGEAVIFVGAIYQRRAVEPPRHGVSVPDLDALAKAAGVTPPTGHPGVAEIEALIADNQRLVPDLKAAIATLSQLDLESRVFQFYRQRAKAVASRAFAELTRAPAGP